MLLILAVTLNVTLVWAQGTTTSKVNGRVIDDAGEGVPGATVIAVHTPTGSRFGAVTGTDGFYQIANMNVGGPYTVTISFVGFEDIVRDNIYLSLGQTFKVDGSLSESATELAELVITATADVFDGNRTGPETVVNEKAINDLPTVERSLADFTRLTPQAAVRNDRAVSFSGINNRFNSIFIDGAVNNDVFGLANSGTNGGQAGISPISIDALEQIQIVVAPYDVTLGGFAGGGINAVTRSGTNNFQGSAYYYVRNESLSGKTPTDISTQERIKLDPFTARTYGARLGGPIIKNKLFFFANVEFLREEEPKPFTFDGYEGDSDQSDLNGLINYVNTTFGYDPGGYTNNIGTRNSDKVLAKIDWNINDNHKLSVRHSYVLGQEIDAPRPNSRNIVFFNTGVDFPSKTNSTAVELKSNFGNTASNNLILGLTTVRDDRDIIGDPFPKVEITDGDALIEIGTDNFSYSNIVFQDVFTLTNNFNLYKGKHTWTFGTHWEYFSIENLFTIFSTPRYFYGSLNSFVNGDPGFSLFGHEQLAPGQSEIRLGDEAKNLGPTFNAMQAGFYVQDEIQVNENLKVSLGIRADIPIYLDDAPLENTEFNTSTIPLVESYGYDLKGAQAGKLPGTNVLWSPRVGFNYDVRGEKKTQLRGGLGLFSSRIPWVWPGGVYIRNGLTSSFDASFGPFRATPQQWLERTNTTSPSGDVDLFAKDFKYPQILRTSIGVDHKLPWGMIGSAEFTYTKTVNNIDVKEVNLKPSSVSLTGADDRPIFDQNDQIDPTYSLITFVDNTNKGYTWNSTLRLEKPFDNGFAGSVAYSFTRAEALFDGQGFINSENWRGMHSILGRNNPMVGRSIFDVGSRVIAFLSYRKEYANFAATSISLFYNGQSGQPYSYVYNDAGALNNEDSEERNLIYVPQNQNEIVFADQATAGAQWSALNAYIEGDDYLKDRRGKYAERNQSRTPFESVLDLKITQDFFIKTTSGQRHTLQVSFDIFNFSNFINKDWGRRYFVGNDNFELLTFQGFAMDSNGNPTTVPTFSFNDPGDPWDIVTSGVNSGRWAAQFGLRYSF